MPPKRRTKRGTTSSKRKRDTSPDISSGTRRDVKQRRAKKQEDRDERDESSSYGNATKFRAIGGPEKETARKTYSGQPSSRSIALVDNIDLEDKSSYPPSITTTIDGDTKCSPQDSIPSVASET
ncbi:hypothetical protein V8C40DRAFT_92365 [Trichoderma camerunense]